MSTFCLSCFLSTYIFGKHLTNFAAFVSSEEAFDVYTQTFARPYGFIFDVLVSCCAAVGAAADVGSCRYLVSSPFKGENSTLQHVMLPSLVLELQFALTITYHREY